VTGYGPYETEQDTHAEPMPQAVRDLHRAGLIRSGDPDRLARDTVLSHLIAACHDAGVTIGARDRRTLQWLARGDTSTAQVVIGLISRAYAAGLSRPADVPRLERVRTPEGFYRVLRARSDGAGALTYDPLAENLDADWLDARDFRVGTSAAWIAAGILDQHGEEALWQHLETLAHQLTPRP
jgi:hypothetical protein